MATEADVRKIALSLPETVEKLSWGSPGFRVKDKLFARIVDERDELVIWVDDLGEKDALIASDPKKFFTTPHHDGYKTVLVRLRAIGVKELREVLTDSWRVRAPKRVRDAFDAGTA